jgi:hypothetical protein
MKSKTGINQINVPCTGVSVRAAQPNPRRVGLTLCSHSVVSVTYSFQQPAVFGRGITLAPGQKPFHISREQYGSAIEQPIAAISSAANAVNASIIEVNLQGVNDDS